MNLSCYASMINLKRPLVVRGHPKEKHRITLHCLLVSLQKTWVLGYCFETMLHKYFQNTSLMSAYLSISYSFTRFTREIKIPNLRWYFLCHKLQITACIMLSITIPGCWQFLYFFCSWLSSTFTLPTMWPTPSSTLSWIRHFEKIWRSSWKSASGKLVALSTNTWLD